MGRLPYPEPTSAEVSRRMRRNPRRDTAPEVALRSALHRRGLRFRKDVPLRVPGRVVRPDVVFARPRLAIFVDGCFWHSCPIHGNQPKVNSAYWGPKLERNVARDRAVDEALDAAGWRVLRTWEHEDPEEVADRVAEAVASDAPLLLGHNRQHSVRSGSARMGASVSFACKPPPRSEP